MVIEHFVPSVFNRNVQVYFAVGIDSHSRQRVSELREILLNKAVVPFEA